MKLRNLASGLLVAFYFVAPASAEIYRDRTVPIVADANLDVKRYLGLWYEIARFPNSFEKGCQGVTAEYVLENDGKISVTNTCRVDRPDGRVKTAKGVARVEAPGQLSVTFVPWLPFARGDYWVLYVDKAYSLAVVGAPKGTTGWILARTPTISAAQREAAEIVLKKNGYDAGKLVNVAQQK
jgi:apolipoprotein D and lipocalin family protein